MGRYTTSSMIWIAYVVTGLVALVLVMAGIGSLLPSAHVAARTTTFPRPIGEVFSVLTALESQPTWRRGLQRIERVSETVFREHGRQAC